MSWLKSNIILLLFCNSYNEIIWLKKIQVLTMMSGTWFLSAFWMKTVISKLAHVCAPFCLLTIQVYGICILSSALSSKGLWERPISSIRCSGNARPQCGLTEDGKMEAPLECLGLCAFSDSLPKLCFFLQVHHTGHWNRATGQQCIHSTPFLESRTDFSTCGRC